MIPRLLQLKNFLSYGERTDPLDFDSLHLACLSGNNGNGKSALLDAILWALWGQSRASGHQGIPQDRLINHGRKDMQVEFRFDVEGQTYLAVRRLEKRGENQSPKTTLWLSVQGEDGFTPIGGDSVREVQKAIDEILQIDYESFVNSAFILQGRADEFTRQTPGKRKDILSNLLGFEQYSRLQEQARECARDFDVRISLREAGLEAYEEEISNKDEHEIALASAVAEVSRLEELMSKQAIEIEKLDVLAVEERLAHSEKASQLEAKRRDEAERHVAQTQLDRAQRRLKDIQEVMAREDEIRATFDRHQCLSRRCDQLINELGELAGLQKELSEKQREIDTIRSHQVNRIGNLESRRETYQGQIQAGEQARSRLGELVSREKHLETLRERLSGIREQRTAVAGKWQGLLSNVDNLESDQQDLISRIQILDRDGAACPVCRQSLSDDLREDVKEQARTEWHERNDAKQIMEASVSELATQADRLDEAVSESETDLEAGDETLRQIARLQSAMEQATEAEEQVKILTAKIFGLKTESQSADGWKQLEESLEPVRARAAHLGDPQSELDNVRTELAQIGQVPAEREKLRAARDGLAEAQRRVDIEVQREDDLAVRVDEASNRISELDCHLGELHGSSESLKAMKYARRMTAQQHLQVIEARSAAQQRVNVIEARITEVEKIRQEIASYRQEAGYFLELAECFGQRGVQAMLIEQVMPEVEGYANELLEIITDGRMQVQFLTQRARRGSSSEEPIETLDIIVSDELGTRPYELFSGGEAFRVNFAIRIAISKLLTRRSGTRLQFMVIDEGFGSQDASSRQRLIEAINLIASSFEKILVVTHVDDMKDAFPTRIEIVKDADGSQIYVV